MEGLSTIVVTCIINALITAMFYMLVAVGATLVFGILDIVNFAHGEFYMLGGFIAYVLFGQLHLNYFLTIGVAFLAVGAFGFLIEKFIFARFRKMLLQSFIVCMGLIWIFRESMRFIFGIWDKHVPVVFKGIIEIGKISFSVERLVITIVGFLLIIGLYFFIDKTNQGRAMRAIAQDPEAAALQGVDINYISSLAFGIGCGLAAIAGVLIAPLLYVSTGMGAGMIITVFNIIILGGLGSVPGCLLGSLILGFVNSFGGTFFPQALVNLMIYMSMFILLVLRPRGLLGHA
jgi:branched-chain amino acid transport system permease protein